MKLTRLGTRAPDAAAAALPASPSGRRLPPSIFSLYLRWYSSSAADRLPVLKSSSCRKDFCLSMSHLIAGGYWPGQYHPPPSQSVFSRIQFLDLSDTDLIL